MDGMATFAIGGETVVRRLGFGAMRLTGERTWGPPADPGTADAHGPNVSEELIAAALHP